MTYNANRGSRRWKLQLEIASPNSTSFLLLQDSHKHNKNLSKAQWEARIMLRRWRMVVKENPKSQHHNLASRPIHGRVATYLQDTCRDIQKSLHAQLKTPILKLNPNQYENNSYLESRYYTKICVSHMIGNMCKSGFQHKNIESFEVSQKTLCLFFLQVCRVGKFIRI